MLTVAYWKGKNNKRWESQIRRSAGLDSVEILTNQENDSSYGAFYARVLKEAQNDVIVFIDRHVNIKTDDWGHILLRHFSDSQEGILGLSGSLGLPASGCWWEDQDVLVGRVWFKEEKEVWESKYSELMPGKRIPVICIDGVFMAVHRQRIRHIFDAMFDAYYLFDTDFTFANYLSGVGVAVIFDIEIIISAMHYDKEVWDDNRKIFVAKYPQLPYQKYPDIILHQHDIQINKGPKLSIIVPMKKASVELFSTLESIYEKSQYGNKEIIIIDHSSSKEELRKVKEFIREHTDTRILSYKGNRLSHLYNEVVMLHLSTDSELILFCNENIILINDAITRMVQVLLENKEVCGTVGARLHFGNNHLRHFGFELVTMDTEKGLAVGISHQGISSCYGYQNAVVKDILGSSKDFLLVTREVFAKAGGFNTSYETGLEDCELNVRCILQGRTNFLAGDAVCYHLEDALPSFKMQDYARLADLVDDHFEKLSPYFQQIYSP